MEMDYMNIALHLACDDVRNSVYANGALRLAQYHQATPIFVSFVPLPLLQQFHLCLGLIIFRIPLGFFTPLRAPI